MGRYSYVLQNGKPVKLGDILKGENTHYMLVIKNKSNNEYMGIVIECTAENLGQLHKIKVVRMDYNLIFELDEIIKSWKNIDIVGNLLEI